VTALRLPIAFVLACGATVGLFGFLRALIAGGGSHEDVVAPTKIEFVRLRRDTQVEEKKREKKERPEKQPAPTTQQLSVTKQMSETLSRTVDLDLSPGSDVVLEGLQIGRGGAGGFGMGAGLGDSDTVPLVRVEPTYPEQAAERGIEGWVEVEFTITTSGAVKDARIVTSTSNVFDRAALQAVRKWKYRPKIEDGKPVERPGVRTVLKFTLEK
jgi:protein TonB